MSGADSSRESSSETNGLALQRRTDLSQRKSDLLVVAAVSVEVVVVPAVVVAEEVLLVVDRSLFWARVLKHT